MLMVVMKGVDGRERKGVMGEREGVDGRERKTRHDPDIDLLFR